MVFLLDTSIIIPQSATSAYTYKYIYVTFHVINEHNFLSMAQYKCHNLKYYVVLYFFKPQLFPNMNSPYHE